MRSAAAACLSGAHAGILKLHFLAATGAAPMVDPYWGGHIVIWLAGRLAEATEMHKVKWAGETDKCIKSANSSHFSAWFSCRVLCLPKTFSFGNKSRGSNCWFTGQDQKNKKHLNVKMWLFPKVHWSIQSPRISPLSVEVLPTSTDEVPWLLSQCLCNAAAAAAVSSHILSSGEKHEICSIQRTRQRKKKSPSRSSLHLLSARVCLSHSVWTRLAPQTPRRANQQVKWAAPVLVLGFCTGLGGGGEEHQWHIKKTSGGKFSASPSAANFKSEEANVVLNYRPK